MLTLLVLLSASASRDALLLAAVPHPPQSCESPEDVAPIEDARLKAAIQTELERDGDVTCADMERLSKLLAPESDIHSLGGLEHAAHLERLVLRKNAIQDLTPLAGLKELRRLSLSDNRIRNIAPLRGLRKLEVLGLDGNLIEDLTALLENVDFGRGDSLDVRRNCLDLTEGSEDREAIRALESRQVEIDSQPQKDCTSSISQAALPPDFKDSVATGQPCRPPRGCARSPAPRPGCR